MKKLVCLLVVLAMASNASAIIVAGYDFEGNFDDVSGFGLAAPATQAGSTFFSYDDAGIVNDIDRGSVLSLANGASLKIGPRHNAHSNNDPSHVEKLDWTQNGAVNGAYSMGAWIKTSTMGSSVNYVIAVGQGTGARMGQLGEDGNTAGFRGAWTSLNTSTGKKHSQKSQQTADFEWHHLAVTWDGTTLTQYIDGAFAGSQSGGGTHTSGSTYDGPTIGAKPYHYDTGQYTGLIDDAYFANTAMTENEINFVMANGIPEPMTVALLGLGGLFLRRRKK